MIRINGNGPNGPFKHLRVILAYKNFRAFQGVSHIGLGVAGMNNVKVLRHAGIRAEVWPIKNEVELRQRLNLAASKGEPPVTHVIVSAPWISNAMWSQLSDMFPEIKFAMNCHSNVGFLQADTGGIERLREGLALSQGVCNFTVAGNSRRFQKWVEDAYGVRCQYLPNLYYLDHLTHSHRPTWAQTGGVLRLGAFGATRALKNFLSAIAAGIEISRELKAQTELHVSTEREDGPDTKRILSAGHALSDGVANFKIVKTPWAPWPKFRKMVGSMHLLLQPSYTESFNMVTADGAAEGVPSVVSDAITWAPKHWRAEVDDVFSIARTGVHLLHDPHSAAEGLKALKEHNRDGLNQWIKYLVHDDRANEDFSVFSTED